MRTCMCRVLLWMAVLSLMAGIYAFSAQPGAESDALTAAAVMPLAELMASMQAGDAAAAVDTFYVILGTIVRKIAHVCEYALLGFLIHKLLKEYGLITPWLAFFIAVAYAVTDEVHQLFVPGRSGRMSDVMIDSLGVAIGIFAERFISNIRRKKHVHHR